MSVSTCIDDLYILNLSGQKLAQMLQFAYFHPVSGKSKAVKRLPHSKFSASGSHLFSVTLCLICVVWSCIDDLYILNVSGQKLAPNLQFAYFHTFSVKSQSVKRLRHSKFSASASHLFSATLCLICVVWPCIDNLYILNVMAKNLRQSCSLHICIFSKVQRQSL